MQLEDALSLAWSQLDKYGLTNWSLQLDERTRFLGHCHYEKKAIFLSVLFVEQHGQLDVLDTILHEIAHALVGPGHGHDEVWVLKALELGAHPVPCKNCFVARKSEPSVIHL